MQMESVLLISVDRGHKSNHQSFSMLQVIDELFPRQRIDLLKMLRKKPKEPIIFF